MKLSTPKRRDRPTVYVCIDGPYAGWQIAFGQGSTAVFRLDSWHGHYERERPMTYGKSQRLPKAVWKNYND